MRVPQVGEELPNVDLLVKRNSYTLVSDVAFWDDEAETQPSDLVGDGISGTIEVTSPVDGTTIEWDAVVTGNRLVWELTSAQTNVTWDYAEGKMVLDKAGQRHVINYLSVRVQG
jgi:hypothetical protein